MSDAKLTLTSRKLAYFGSAVLSNPDQKSFDWKTSKTLDVENPSETNYTISPGVSKTIFSGTVTTTVAADTELELSLSSISNSTYRIAWTGVGAAPGFRTDRGLALSGLSVTVTANNNQTVTLASSAGEFVTVQVGDNIFLPGATTGDGSGPFNTLNEGLWVVLAIDGTSSTLQLQRPSGTGFSAYTETVSITDDAQVLGYSSAGVQVGDQVEISAGFSSTVQGDYTIKAVTADWFEVESTLPLPVSETAVPGVSGIAFYDYSVSWLYIEGDQLSSVRINGDTGNKQKITPTTAGDPALVGWYEIKASIWSLVVVNLSTSSLKLKVFTCE